MNQMFRNLYSGDWLCKIVSWILESIDKNIGIPMQGFRTTAKMWKQLEKVYHQFNQGNFELRMTYAATINEKRKDKSDVLDLCHVGTNMN